MNPDEFEQSLGRRPLRQAPLEWRAQILEAARTATQSETSADESLVGWREWLARFPSAWGALATVWLALVGVNLLLSGPRPHAAAPAALASAHSSEPLTVWSLQRAQLNLLNETPPNTGLPAETPLRPRSEGKRNERFGEGTRANNLKWTV